MKLPNITIQSIGIEEYFLKAIEKFWYWI